MSRKFKYITLVVVLLSVVISYIYALPFIKVKKIKNLLKSGDIELISEYINFHLLRENIKSQFKTSFIQEIKNDEEIQSNPFSGLGVGLGFMMIDKAIDTFITPSGIESIYKNNVELFDVDASFKRYGYKTNMFYKSLKWFYVTIKKTESSKENIQFILKREGLNWQLINIKLSQSSYFVNLKEHNHLQEEEKHLLEELNRLKTEFSPWGSSHQQASLKELEAAKERMDGEEFQLLSKKADNLFEKYKQLSSEANILFKKYNRLNVTSKLFEGDDLIKKGNSLFKDANISLSESNRLMREMHSLLWR